MNELEKMAANLKELRSKAGMTQIEIAEILDVNKTTVMRWETGGATPDVKTILWYADRFDVSLDWIFGRKRTVRGSLRDLIAREVGDSIVEALQPGGKVYPAIAEEIGDILRDYGQLEEMKE